MMQDVSKYALNCEQIAKSNAPFKTGNLRFNAISHMIMHDGFKVIAMYHTADYIHHLEQGTMHSKKNIGFWSIKTALEQSKYMQFELGGNQLEANAVMYEALERVEDSKTINMEQRFKTMIQSENRSAVYTLG